MSSPDDQRETDIPPKLRSTDGADLSPQSSEQTSTVEERAAEAHSGEEGAHGRSRPPLTRAQKIKKLAKHLYVTWIVLIVLGIIVDKVHEVVQMNGTERSTKLNEMNENAREMMDQMKPKMAFGQFFSTLGEPHGLQFGSWQAPFNVNAALNQLDESEGLESGPIQEQITTLELEKGASSLSQNQPTARDPVGSAMQGGADVDSQIANLRSMNSISTLAIANERKQIEASAIEKMLPLQGGSHVITLLVNAVVALPDAYLGLTRTLLPRLPWAMRLAVVALVFFVASQIWATKRDWGGTAAFLLLLPFAASLIAGVIAAFSWEIGQLFHTMHPQLSVASSTVIAPFISWTSTKVVEHHLVEGTLHTLEKHSVID